MFFNQVKTAILLATLSGILMALGAYIGGTNGLILFTIISLCINGYAYFFSDKMVLRMYKAQPLDKTKYAGIYNIVEELAAQAKIPMPKLWLVPMDVPNAFATGRNPQNASVAVTQGILGLLDESELRGVLAHELSHITNRDILISSIAATLATAIGFIAYMMRNMAMFGGMSHNNERKGNPLALLVISIFMPLAATLIQLAISRSREYLADESGSELSLDPLALAAALQKLEFKSKEAQLRGDQPIEPTTAHMFIVKPFSFGGISNLFATHPPMHKRIEKLRAMYDRMTFRGR